MQLVFESSGKWPNERSALLHTKAAFYIMFGQLMEKQYGVITVVTDRYVDVLQVCDKGNQWICV